MLETLEMVVLSNKLALKQSCIHGMGVHSSIIFQPADIIETCPVVLVYGKAGSTAIDNTELSNYVHFWESEEGADITIIAGGFGMFYNHSDDPNSEWDYAEIEGRDYIVMTAIKAILPGEEITFYYGEEASEDLE